jgi:acylphosphatase
LLKSIRAHLIISGKVQNVGFRSMARWKARKLGLKGWVRNVGDDVEAVIEGDETLVRQMIRWCRKGPENADVEDIKIEFEDYTGEFENFQIL